MEVACDCPHGDPDSKGKSLDHLIRAQQQRLRDRDAERLRGLEVDDEFKLGGLLDGKVPGLGALENLVDVCSDKAIEFSKHWSVSHQPTGTRDLSPFVYRRNLL